MADGSSEAPGVRVIQLLLQAISLHAVEGAPGDREKFRKAIDSVSLAVGEADDGQTLMGQATTAIWSLQEYNQRTSTFLSAQNQELQAIAKMLTSTIGTISKFGNEGIRQLGEIERQLFSTTQLQDVRMMKAKLGECLDQIRQEAIRQREETNKTVDQLTQEVERTRTQIGTRPSLLDEVTKLPPRPVAEYALTEACQTEEAAFVAVMLVDRIQIYNVRFGREVGDEVLQHFADWIRKRRRPEDRLFRWSGPALVALMPRVNRIEAVREELERVLAARFEYTVKTASRGILLPVSARWSLLPLMAAPRLLFHKIDSFANLHGSRE